MFPAAKQTPINLKDKQSLDPKINLQLFFDDANDYWVTIKFKSANPIVLPTQPKEILEMSTGIFNYRVNKASAVALYKNDHVQVLKITKIE